MRAVLVQARKPSPISAVEQPVITRMSEVLPDCTLPSSHTTGANSLAAAAISSSVAVSVAAVGHNAAFTAPTARANRSRNGGFPSLAFKPEAPLIPRSRGDVAYHAVLTRRRRVGAMAA